MKKIQGGFTLIELVVVIVLLGILGVTALGKFQDLSSEAEQAAVQGIASELTGASNVNYAASLLNTGTSQATSAGDACTATIANALLTSVFPTGYTIADTTACSAAGEASICAVTETASSAAASAYIICTN